MLTETTVPPGIPEALAALNGHRLAVATSKPHAFAEPLLSAMGLREHFDVIAGPDLKTPAEDKTQTLGRALDLLGPTRAIMVGDRSFDIVAARAHRLPSIGVTWGIGTLDELQTAGADRLIAAPSELPATAAILLAQ
jgi:phosphoglycolate phosphatase